ncbi:unnamed protein product [Sphagnum jensenii]
MFDDEAATAQQLNRFCENESVFSYTRIPRRRQPVELPPAGAGPSVGVTEEGTVTNREHSKADAGAQVCNNEGWMERASESSGAGNLYLTWCEDGIDQQKCAPKSESGENTDEGAQLEGQVESESQFGDTELEKLVQLEGSQQILQLTL